jgi:hypothetical protein
MNHRTVHLAAAATLIAYTTACTLPPEPPPPPEPPTRYYSAAVQVDQSEVRDQATGEDGPLSADAATIIRPGVTVAFYPPNQCVTTPSEAGTGASKEGDLILMDCGALMSRLEAQAGKAKYEVVSWQALKHRDKPPLEMARELKVDVMFEVNELSIDVRNLGTSRAMDFRFGQQTSAADRRDMAVTPEVATRCRAVFDPEVARLAPATLEAVLDAKAVEVKTGRALWYYKRTKQESGVSGQQRGLELYYPSPGKIDWSPPPQPTSLFQRNNLLQTLGGVFAVVGAATSLSGAVVLPFGIDDNNASMVKNGKLLLGFGVSLLVGGVVMLAIGNRLQRKKARPPVYPAPVYDLPEQVVCATSPVVPPWQETAPGPAQPPRPTTSSTYSFHEQTAGGKDIERARIEKLLREAADEFVARLGTLATG